MSVTSLEIQRARKVLGAFCARRNPGMRSHGKQLCCRQEGEDLLLVETCVPASVSSGEAVNPLVRLSYRDGDWLLFCPDRGGCWLPYPHLPRADSIAVVLDELEQAPLHVHW